MKTCCTRVGKAVAVLHRVVPGLPPSYGAVSRSFLERKGPKDRFY